MGCAVSQEKEHTELKQIIYVSMLSNGQDETCIPEIMQQAVENNSRSGFTGLLIYINRSFLQILEGEPAALDDLYNRIRKDTRHTMPMTLGTTNITERQFADWSMGLADVTAPELDSLGNKNDFFQKGHCLTELDESLARKILQEFRSGLWRVRVY